MYGWQPCILFLHVCGVSFAGGIWDEIARYCMPFAEGKDVADLGAGDGTLGKLLPQADQGFAVLFAEGWQVRAAL